MKTWGLNDQLMAMAAHRYCLGRRSYIVGACIDWIRSNLENFERNTVRVMARDTLEAIIDETAGSKIIDEPGWMRLFKELYTHMQQEDRDRVLQAVRHRNRDTLEAIIDETAGSKIIDESGWMRLFKELYAHMQQEDRDWVLQAVRHRNYMPRYDEVMKEIVGFIGLDQRVCGLSILGLEDSET